MALRVRAAKSRDADFAAGRACPRRRCVTLVANATSSSTLKRGVVVFTRSLGQFQFQFQLYNIVLRSEHNVCTRNNVNKTSPNQNGLGISSADF